jgi:hypothetical protein
MTGHQLFWLCALVIQTIPLAVFPHVFAWWREFAAENFVQERDK